MAKILFFQPNQADHAAGLPVAAVGEESIAFQDGAMGTAINHVHAFAVQNYARQSVNVGKVFAAADVFKRICSFWHGCANKTGRQSAVIEAQATVPVVSTEASASGVLPNASAAFTTMVLWI